MPRTPAERKASLRRWARRLGPVAEDPAPFVAALVEFLGPDPGTVGAYVALPDEVDVSGLVAALDDVALPRLGADGSVSWHRPGSTTETHPLGLTQPGADAPEVGVDELDALVVPGRVFSCDGIRLGRGGGHYDRLLPRLRPGIPVVGVAPRARVVPNVPVEAHDVPMTHLCTEAGVRPVGVTGACDPQG